VPYDLQYLLSLTGAPGSVVVKALHYKPAGRGFDSIQPSAAVREGHVFFTCGEANPCLVVESG
jgi:hypothetical protein